MKKNKIATFYDARMVLANDSTDNFSMSPLKPRLLMEYLKRKKLLNYFDIREFKPFHEQDFLLAHTKEYVHDFFTGKRPLCDSNGLTWSAQFAESVKYTNSSLYHAILNSVQNPEEVSFSPTSGFHHAAPNRGSGFCTFSGQVIASTKLFRQYGLSGAYIDLDGHFGNSIEDSRSFVPNLNFSVPKGSNINIAAFTGKKYIAELYDKLSDLRQLIMAGKCHYVVFCHGADSHEFDDLGGGCTTQEWIKYATIVYKFIKEIEEDLQKPFPLSLSLFGGYREDDYDSVLSLHTADLVQCLSILCGNPINYRPEVKSRG